jgi:hypothetical protein
MHGRVRAHTHVHCVYTQIYTHIHTHKRTSVHERVCEYIRMVALEKARTRWGLRGEKRRRTQGIGDGTERYEGGEHTKRTAGVSVNVNISERDTVCCAPDHVGVGRAVGARRRSLPRVKVCPDPLIVIIAPLSARSRRVRHEQLFLAANSPPLPFSYRLGLQEGLAHLTPQTCAA